MIRPSSVLLFLLCTAGIAYGQDHEFRKWRMRDGRRTRTTMAVAEIDGRVVTLKREGSDRQVRVVISGLSDEDQAYLQEHFPEQMAQRAVGAEGNAAQPAEPASRAETPRVASRSDTAAARWPAPVVTDDNLQEWLTFIQPTQEELKWRNIRWHNNLATAQEEARRLQRPILLWTMNGNPCGET